MTISEQIAASLGGQSRKANGGYMARCPIHDDSTSSLSIDEKDGKILLKCMAGCDSREIIGLIRSNGHWPKETKQNRPAKKRTAAIFDYSIGAEIVFQAVRYEPKGFSQRRPDGQGGWIYNLQGVEPFPYNLEAVQASEWCLLVEGEKDVERLKAIGITASCNPMGAGKWRESYNKHFAGKQVAIIPDNDEPGRKHAQDVAQHLQGIASSVKVVELPGLPPKGDVSDWLETDTNTREILVGLVEGTPEWNPSEAYHATPDDDPLNTAIDRLANLPPLKYDMVRVDEAKALGVRPATLDATVKAAQKQAVQSNDTPFNEVEPWPEAVDGAELLTAIVSTIRRFIICEHHTAVAAALWVAMTWFMDVVQVAPLALITAPEKRCGKTMLLTLLGKLVPRPLTSSSITPSALFRSIDLWKPTLLIDETDACLKDNEELRGLINCGHTRDSAYTIRCVGDDHTPTPFNTWSAKALSGIGHAADTIMDRSIILELRRKLPDENVERIRHAEPALFQELSSKLARFADDNANAVKASRPELPHDLNDRAQDNWEPLLSIANIAGGDWYHTAVNAALKIAGGEVSTQTVGTELLADIQEIFVSKSVDRIFTVKLVEALCADDEKMWLGYNRGFPIKPGQLSKKLKAYGIHSKSIRIGTENAKGFEKKQFAEAFLRYIPITPFSNVTTPQPAPALDLQTFSKRHSTNLVTDEKPRKSPSILACGVVTDKIPPQASTDVVDLTGIDFEVAL
jgi:hypothetical protein